MINFDSITNEHKTKRNPNWGYIPDYPYKIIITCSSGSRNKNALSNLISQQPNIDKICLYAKDPHEPKHQLLIKKR